MNTTPEESKREAAMELLANTGIMRSNYAPPYLRLLWRMGINMPPPHFAEFWQNAVFAGCFYSIVWGLLMYWVVWSKANLPQTTMLGSALVAGALFGLALASYYAYGKRKHGLPSWRDFQPDISNISNQA